MQKFSPMVSVHSKKGWPMAMLFTAFMILGCSFGCLKCQKVLNVRLQNFHPVLSEDSEVTGANSRKDLQKCDFYESSLLCRKSFRHVT